jgi:hypothetical protein
MLPTAGIMNIYSLILNIREDKCIICD